MFQLKSNEDIEIEKVLVTPFEKAIKILKKVINFLGENNPLSEEVNWVLKIIISQKLYSYEVLNKTNFEKESTNDLKLVLGFLNMYSQKDIFNPNINRRSQTVDYHSSDNVRNNISHILSQYKKKYILYQVIVLFQIIKAVKKIVIKFFSLMMMKIPKIIIIQIVI